MHVLQQKQKRRFDMLDKFVLIVALFIFAVVVPTVVGAQNTPYLGGQPAALNPQIRAEQKFIDDARQALSVISDTHASIATLRPAGGPAESYLGSQTMQSKVEGIEQALGKWKRITPPGRFAGLYRRLGDALAGYQKIATEAWAYYGDLNTAHLNAINEALPAGDAERKTILQLLNSMDFSMSPPAIEAAQSPKPDNASRGKPSPTQTTPATPAFSK